MTPELERLIKEFEYATQDYGAAMILNGDVSRAKDRRHKAYGDLCRAIELMQHQINQHEEKNDTKNTEIAQDT